MYAEILEDGSCSGLNCRPIMFPKWTNQFSVSTVELTVFPGTQFLKRLF
jgi:hypothetical protein